MRQYFFDYVSKNETLRDYKGRQFSADRLAHEYAQLLAIHLQHDPEAIYSGWSIVARDVKGAEIFSVLVPPSDNDQSVAFKTASSDVIRNLPL